MTSNATSFKHGEVEPAETIKMLRKFNVITILQTLVMLLSLRSAALRLQALFLRVECLSTVLALAM